MHSTFSGNCPTTLLPGMMLTDAISHSVENKRNDLMSSQEVRLETNTPARTTSLAAVAKDDAHVLKASPPIICHPNGDHSSDINDYNPYFLPPLLLKLHIIIHANLIHLHISRRQNPRVPMLPG